MKVLVLNVLIILLLTSCQSKTSTDIKISDIKASAHGDKIIVDDLGLSWNEVTRCNCMFAIDNDKFWDKYLFFARDSVESYGIIQLNGHGERLRIPISKYYYLSQRTKGEEWTESFANDSIRIELKGSPIESRILKTYSYSVDFVMIYNNDTIRQNIIGHCRY